jgi:hypothetical protein
MSEFPSLPQQPPNLNLQLLSAGAAEVADTGLAAAGFRQLVEERGLGFRANVEDLQREAFR